MPTTLQSVKPGRGRRMARVVRLIRDNWLTYAVARLQTSTVAAGKHDGAVVVEMSANTNC